MPCSTQILIFSRFPIPRQAKTRLIPALGPDGSARLHRRMTEHALDVIRAVAKPDKAADVEITICYTGARRQHFRAWLGPDLQYTPQPSGDLGVRMRRAFELAFRNGAKHALAVGCDVPDLSLPILQQALNGLHHDDVVLGPTTDGGYYLIGMKRFHPELFTAIDWGTDFVCNQTRRAIERKQLTVAELSTLRDVDRPEDLDAFYKNQTFADIFSGKPMISVIIPTLNEATSLGRTLERAHCADTIEIIVADGGSCDTTREIAKQYGALVLEAHGGRALQQNAAAVTANGRLLLFLHADTLLPNNYADLIRRALDNPSTVAGAFRFKTDGSGVALRLIEWAANFRSAVLRWPYGDQGLFMEKRVFDEMGGFAALPIMEDFNLVGRLRRRGFIVSLREPAITSARRWLRLGVLRTTIINQIMIIGFIGGIPIPALNRFYRINETSGHKEIPAKEESQP